MKEVISNLIETDKEAKNLKEWKEQNKESKQPEIIKIDDLN